MQNSIAESSRLSLFRLSKVRPPRYTGHLAWHGMLAIMFNCTKLTLKYGHSLFRLPASAGQYGTPFATKFRQNLIGVCIQYKSIFEDRFLIIDFLQLIFDLHVNDL